MNGRYALALAVVLAAVVVYGLQAKRQTDSELRERISRVENELEELKRQNVAKEMEGLRAENARLAAENSRGVSERSGAVMDPRVARASHSTNASEAYDPLAFYRRNPELMKRYFPHLFQQPVQPAQSATDVPPPPPDTE